MNQWTKGYCLTKKTRGRKSRETAPLNKQIKGAKPEPEPKGDHITIFLADLEMNII
jgi:hypothetical protein